MRISGHTPWSRWMKSGASSARRPQMRRRLRTTSVSCTGRSFGPERRWAVEDCRHLSRRLERDLLSAGEVIVAVPPKLMANTRDSARTYGKSDPIDALAVARAALREPNLPAAQLDGPSRELKLLVDHREHLVAERTRTAMATARARRDLGPDATFAHELFRPRASWGAARSNDRPCRRDRRRARHPGPRSHATDEGP
jgi:transposase